MKMLVQNRTVDVYLGVSVRSWFVGERVTARRPAALVNKTYATCVWLVPSFYFQFIALLFLAPLIAGASDCTRTTTGLKPLTAPFFTNYKTFPGGLYPNTSNKRPGSHEVGGLAQAALVRPRNSSGDVDEQNGRIVLLS